MTQRDAQSGKRRVRRHPFKRRDVERAMKSARAEGLEIGAVEVVTHDGTRIRVFGKDASSILPIRLRKSLPIYEPLCAAVAALRVA
jgi:hypothetical protein